MYQIHIYNANTRVATLSYADQQARENAALAVAREWRDRGATHWRFIHLEQPGPKFTMTQV